MSARERLRIERFPDRPRVKTTFRIPADLNDALTADAKRSNIGRSLLLTTIIEAWFEDEWLEARIREDTE